MKKALVVGGANGIGLALAKEFIKNGYYTLIYDKSSPDAEADLKDGAWEYVKCNLLMQGDAMFRPLASDPDIEVVMLTAGYGRVCDLEYIDPAEIQNMMQVNAVSTMKIIREFYGRVKTEKPFYLGVMGSIAGLVSTPAFSAYAASKAAICRFVESVNIELEVAGVENRILCVAPGSVKGTKFHGGKNDISMVSALAKTITEKLRSHETLYIPEYDEIYSSVIERYKDDPHKFGLDSYRYKLDAGRVINKKGVKIGYLSGTFDLFHYGHLALLRRAKEQCDYLIVGVHPNANHKAKKTFIPFEERMAVVGGCRYVDKVVESCLEDSDAWDKHHYDILFVGSDYKGTERFRRYEEYFADKGVEIMYFDYTQGTSSTQIRENIIKETLDNTQSNK